MPTESFIKQPSETFTIAGDYVNVLETAETITLGSSSVTSTDVNGDPAPGVLSGIPSVATSRLKQKIQGGTEELSPYKITFLAVTSLANAFEIDVFMEIVET